MIGGDCDCLADKREYGNGSVDGSVLIDRQFNQDRSKEIVLD